ncbi:MAG: tRNA (adenosine(37)-N6)-threonylcarbamoyltransferase complex ATPase subunit type 1 TsaE [Caulobacteraceae bacterium]|nr:tRNA (adenosine(37)-N6)-threonylcarbamoyltransferase complex ATPase subunit type 1 TsaE [Caulobacter sp.]
MTLPTPQSAAALGAAVAALLRPGEAVCLSGPLGAGKSTLARGLVRALTSPHEEVPSPTFTLVQGYAGRDFPVAHLDLYRLKRPEEADELGLDEALEAGCAVIEWPERLAGALPVDRLDVTLAADAAGGRVATLTGHGVWRGRERDLLRPPRP